MRKNFLAAWESVRPVPVVDIDFGNGRRLRRTLNGNIAWYVCAPDGRVADILPGLSSPEAFLMDLRDALRLLARAGNSFERVVRSAHAEALLPPDLRAEARTMITSKSGIETPLKKAIWASAVPPNPETLLLAGDDALNRIERRPRVHRLLAQKVVTPPEVTRQVYREILHCDLDDPYLGLVPPVFGRGAYESP